jgi:hypothetical protein
LVLNFPTFSENFSDLRILVDRIKLRGVYYQKMVFFEKEVFGKTVFFFYSRISVKNAVYLNIKKI